MQFGLERRFLTDKEVFDRETEKIFSKFWVCLGRQDEFPTSKTTETAFRTYQVGPYSILGLNSPDGRWKAFHNICRHRGTRLVRETAGVLRNSCITCPYHAWTYNDAGELLGCPNMADLENFERSDFGLKPVACVSWAGFLLANLGAVNASFEHDYASMIQRLANWRLDTLQVAATLNYVVQANWKLIFQNYSECYHCPTVHPSLSRLTPYRSASTDLQEGPFLGGPMHLSENCETVSADGQRVADPIESLDENQRRRVYYYTLFPNWFISAHPDYVLVHQLTRQSPTKTSVRCHFLAAPDADQRELGRAVEQWDEINRQDWDVCELTQCGVDSPAYQPGPYSPLEPMLVAFDRYYRSIMNAATD